MTKLKASADEKLKVPKMTVSILGKKALWVKDTMLVTSISSFSHSVFPLPITTQCRILTH